MYFNSFCLNLLRNCALEPFLKTVCASRAVSKRSTCLDRSRVHDSRLVCPAHVGSPDQYNAQTHTHKTVVARVRASSNYRISIWSLSVVQYIFIHEYMVYELRTNDDTMIIIVHLQ